MGCPFCLCFIWWKSKMRIQGKLCNKLLYTEMQTHRNIIKNTKDRHTHIYSHTSTCIHNRHTHPPSVTFLSLSQTELWAATWIQIWAPPPAAHVHNNAWFGSSPWQCCRGCDGMFMWVWVYVMVGQTPMDRQPRLSEKFQSRIHLTLPKNSYTDKTSDNSLFGPRSPSSQQ